MNLGDRIKAARQHAGMTQAALAKRVGVSQQMIQKIEAGNSDGTSALLDICIETGVSPSWLARGQGPMVLSHAVGPDYTTISDAIRLIEAVATARRRKAPNITPAQVFVAMEIVRAAELSSQDSPPAADFVAQYLTRLAEVEKEHGVVAGED